MQPSAQSKIKKKKKKIARKTRKSLAALTAARSLVAASSAESCMWKRIKTVTGKNECLVKKQRLDGF